MTRSEPGPSLVTVIVPSYNAARTIDATLASVRSQTHRALEIVVVDDGSTDDTRDTVRRHAAADDRVRLVSQANGGVAAARNRGLAESTGEFIAPIDADDLWHPEKVERQLALIAHQPAVGLVSTAYSVIDAQGEITLLQGGSMPRNNQFIDLCRRNFIGNGSSALMRRSAVERFGGYDRALRDNDAEGCEDLKLYLQVAERYQVEMIRVPLTGYRQMADNMSSDGRRMLRSFDRVRDEFCDRRPELRRPFRAHRSYLLCWLTSRALRAGRWQEAAELGGALFKAPNPVLPTAIAGALLRRFRSLTAGPPTGGRPFLELA